jgi:type VI secretion system secreted protein VgrG
MANGMTQTARLITINTPFGPNKLAVTSLTGHEEMSRLFHFQIEMLSEDGGLDAKKIVGKPVAVAVQLADGSNYRYFHGIVTRFGQRPSEGNYFRYYAEAAPWLWYLTQTANCRIFQEKSIPEIIAQIFSDFGFSDYENAEIRGSHEKWNYCVQYRETAFDFISRLIEQEGIFYFFRHEQNKHVMVLSDQPGAHKPCPVTNTFRMQPATGHATVGEDTIHDWQHHYEFRPGKWAQTDYNFEEPAQSLLATTPSVVEIDGNKKFEIFDYPGEYLTKSEGDKLNKIRMQEEEVTYDTVGGSGDCRPFSPGLKFTLQNHARRGENGTYVLTCVTHSAKQGGYFGDEGTGETGYSNSFTCIPQAVPFRPARQTAKPIVYGTQTAVVTGPPGEEIYTDKYGRVKVQFHWDREGRKDDKTSCWIRVAQPWAGKTWGAIWIPRIGQEVVVDFLEGDPDRPLIIGSVYNAEQMPPYDLPANKTQSGIKSRSSMRGGTSNFNEIRFEDKKGSEEIVVHAERNLSTTVEADETRSVGGSRTTTIQKDDLLTIKEGNRETKVEKGNDTLVVAMGDKKTDISKGNCSTAAPLGKYSVDAKEIVLTGTQSVKLVCGASTIEMLPALIKISAPMVKIN